MENVQFFFFNKNGVPLEFSPICGLTLRAAGSMRFRWAEQNCLRTEKLSEIANGKIITSVQLNHTKIVYDIYNSFEVNEKIGDGIITVNKDLMPVVTVADCVPIYFFDSKSQVFGVVHSGWKGTGIIENAIEIAVDKYKTDLNNFYIIIGPHIHNCCYIVNEQRANYFLSNFELKNKDFNYDYDFEIPDLVVPLEKDGVCFAGGRNLTAWNNGDGNLYRLSLLRANLNIIKKAGVPDNNVSIIKGCTCCDDIYGSNRRETTLNNSADSFTVQAAFIHW